MKKSIFCIILILLLISLCSCKNSTDFGLRDDAIDYVASEREFISEEGFNFIARVPKNIVVPEDVDDLLGYYSLKGENPSDPSETEWKARIRFDENKLYIQVIDPSAEFVDLLHVNGNPLNYLGSKYYKSKGVLIQTFSQEGNYTSKYEVHFSVDEDGKINMEIYQKFLNGKETVAKDGITAKGVKTGDLTD